ncbi:HNH/endonuclease VII fold putative polymorphic toxin [Acetivibrio straminisolvens]|jgi:hypothetical protein|uniref:HNH/Endo VII superfamily nuclease toxins domain-containing protein n=1 Tax=Acetivibrio straminisolvens JCM 21531 TaxID=1294263 RepID=W4VDQ5_9FIRM|nr:HNH/endonuclease VII fold putative polymorphic toxin [Acetivibrio straminisolvens]GAE90889.1 hypothetical protein JCM21531_4542 [Acetivibrio straminisolvens JCM 21531]
MGAIAGFADSKYGNKIRDLDKELNNRIKQETSKFIEGAKSYLKKILTDERGSIRFGPKNETNGNAGVGNGRADRTQTGKGTGNQPVSRKQALNTIKKDLGIPKSQKPDGQNMVPLVDENGNMILGQNKNFVYSRELTYSVNGKFDAQGNPISSVVIQDHSYGHTYSSGTGNQPLHFNVRPSTNPKNDKVLGIKEHYYFNYRNRK